MVEALSYKLQGRRSDSRWGHRDFALTILPNRNVALGSTQPLTEMSTRDISWGVKAAGADCPEILGHSTCWSAMADTSKKSSKIKH